ncbi:putative cytochrome P450 monooxygenase [Xylariaceae sp. FL0804]|nr:putative cytochrome P450 monooxygenase [Xylariaceae sp. FL0804]
MAMRWVAVSASAAALLVRLQPELAIKESYFWTISTAVTVAVLGQVFYACVLYPEFFSPLRHIPTPKERSWFGGNSKSMGLEYDRIREWTRTIPNDGLIRYYMAGNIERVLVTGPKALNEVLVSKVYDFPKSESLRVKLLRFTGNGILLAEGDQHKVPRQAQRKGLLPSFSYRHIKDLYPVFWAKAVEMAEAIEQQQKQQQRSPGGNPLVDSTVTQISDWAGRVTLDIVGLAAMGRDFGAVRDPAIEFHRQYDRLRMRPDALTRALVLLATVTVGFRAFFRLPTRWNRESREAAAYIRDYARGIVADKRKWAQQQRQQQAQKQKQKQSEADGEGDADGDGTPAAASAAAAGTGKDISSLAMASGAFSDENMVDQMITFLVAGHETIAASLQWAVYALARHPAMQSRLRAEVRGSGLLPASGGTPGGSSSGSVAEKVDALPYLAAFCSEVLRFHPPVPSTVRVARADSVVAGTRVPRGTTLLVLAGATNLDRARWGDDAERFDPERWLICSSRGDGDGIDGNNDGSGRCCRYNSSGGADSNYANLTFLAGPRGCIGSAFARSELLCLVAVLVGRFRIELQDPGRELEIVRAISAAPKDGVMARLTRLEGW